MPTQHGARHQEFQVQAFRAGAWRVVSGHYSAARAKLGLQTIMRATPERPDDYRLCHRDDPDWLPLFSE